MPEASYILKRYLLPFSGSFTTAKPVPWTTKTPRRTVAAGSNTPIYVGVGIAGVVAIVAIIGFLVNRKLQQRQL